MTGVSDALVKSANRTFGFGPFSVAGLRLSGLIGVRLGHPTLGARQTTIVLILTSAYFLFRTLSFGMFFCRESV